MIRPTKLVATGMANEPQQALPSDDRPAEAPSPPDPMRAREAWVGTGDSRSFSELYERLAPALHAWASLRIAPVHRGSLDPDDVVQEVWWRALDAFATYDARKGDFRAWIFQIANRVLLNALRSLRVRGLAAAAGARPRQESLDEDLAAQATSISQKAARSECTKQILQEVEKLDPDDRALFAYCALEGMPVSKAACLLGIGLEAAFKRWQRLRGRLRESLPGSFVDPS